MRLLTILFAVGFLFASCGSDDPVLPECIDAKLDLFKSEACPGTGTGIDAGNLTTFRFKREVVYCFLWGSCSTGNNRIEIFDAECNLICTMDGATAGDQLCDGTLWGDNAEQIDEIWRNN